MLRSLIRNIVGPHASAACAAQSRTDAPLRLHIGGQIPHPDWQIFDVRQGPHVDHQGHCADLARFADASVTDIYASHVIEHLKFATELPRALREFHRVLKPGGTLRASVPDMDALCGLFLDPELSLEQRFKVMQMMFGSQENDAAFHYLGFNEEILRTYLADARFVDIVRVDSFGLFDDTSNMVYKRPISLNVMARKPPGN